MLFLEQTQGFAGDDAGGSEGSSSPSLFELLMQDRMAAGFKPAVEYLAHALCESYPRLALALPVRRLDESYALLRYCVERYFLTRYDSLATEKFYGMKRVLLQAGDGGKTTTTPLTPRARKLALLFAVRSAEAVYYLV
jgi:peroxin-12